MCSPEPWGPGLARQEAVDEPSAVTINVTGKRTSGEQAQLTNLPPEPPQSGIGYVLQKKRVEGEESTSELLAPVSEILGSKPLRLEAGKALDVEYDTGTPPTGFRLGIIYASARDGDQWTLIWSGWWDRAG